MARAPPRLKELYCHDGGIRFKKREVQAVRQEGMRTPVTHGPPHLTFNPF